MPSPLTKYQRQPKQSIDLPSKGRWYSQGSLEKSEELEVFSMTASNEIATKTLIHYSAEILQLILLKMKVTKNNKYKINVKKTNNPPSDNHWI